MDSDARTTGGSSWADRKVIKQAAAKKQRSAEVEGAGEQNCKQKEKYRDKHS